jgi:single-strand DNA-binding protein
MNGINKVILVGRLGAEPKVINGSYATFSVATSDTWKDKTTGEKKELTQWHNIFIANQGLMKIVEFLHKGSLVYIEGSLRTRDNNGKTQTDVVVSAYSGELTLLESKK